MVVGQGVRENRFGEDNVVGRLWSRSLASCSERGVNAMEWKSMFSLATSWCTSADGEMRKQQ